MRGRREAAPRCTFGSDPLRVEPVRRRRGAAASSSGAIARRSPRPRRRIESPPSETMLSGPSSIRSWSRVRGGDGSRSRRAAGPRASQNGTWTAGRRVPSAVLIASPELVPRDRLRPAELDRPARAVSRGRRAARRGRGRRSRSAAHAASPARSPASPASQARDAQEARQHAAVGAEHEARPEDDVLDPAAARPSALQPTSRGSTGRSLPARFRARSSARSAARRSRARPRRGSRCPRP